MDWSGVVKVVLTVLTPLTALIGVSGRKRRLRGEVKDNLALIEELKKDEVLREHTPSIGWIQGRIIVDVAKIAGQALGARKKPIPWGSVQGVGKVVILGVSGDDTPVTV